MTAKFEPTSRIIKAILKDPKRLMDEVIGLIWRIGCDQGIVVKLEDERNLRFPLSLV